PAVLFADRGAAGRQRGVPHRADLRGGQPDRPGAAGPDRDPVDGNHDPGVPVAGLRLRPGYGDARALRDEAAALPPGSGARARSTPFATDELAALGGAARGGG